MIKHWGESIDAFVECGDILCEWTHSDHMKTLKNKLHSNNLLHKEDSNVVSLSVYNIHSWWERSREHYPHICELKTNLTMVESEEAKQRYNGLFEPSFKNFDGFSTTHPTASVPRVYFEAFLNQSEFLTPKNWSTLVKGGVYVASDCHRHDSANANRDGVVFTLRKEGFRIDGLGRCMKSHTPTPEGIELISTKDNRYNLIYKREVISKYMFYMAFENSLEPGYVTEKPFDGIFAGIVPVYLGDHIHLKSLLPDPKAAIYIGDYNGNYTALASYLNYLTTNETAYEEHRAWRKGFDEIKHCQKKEILSRSWFCRVCQWANKEAPIHHKRTRHCHTGDSKEMRSIVFTGELEGKAVRGDTREIFLIKDNILRPIPDMDTFTKLNLELEKIVHLTEADMKELKRGGPIVVE